MTFVSVSGDVPTLEVVSSQTDSGAAVAATTVVDGNALGGTFALQTADGYTTDQLPYDVSTGALEAALEALSGVGAIEVTTGWELDESSEYGKAYMIEFTTAEGDVADLIPVTWNLTGTEAVAHIREYTKGSKARGDAPALSFATPLECSESQVTSTSTSSSSRSTIVGDTS